MKVYDTPDLRNVIRVAEGIGRSINCWKLVVTKSTVPIGTGDKVRETIAALTDLPFEVASNPEFSKTSTAISARRQ